MGRPKLHRQNLGQEYFLNFWAMGTLLNHLPRESFAHSGQCQNDHVFAAGSHRPNSTRFHKSCCLKAPIVTLTLSRNVCTPLKACLGKHADILVDPRNGNSMTGMAVGIKAALPTHVGWHSLCRLEFRRLSLDIAWVQHASQGTLVTIGPIRKCSPTALPDLEHRHRTYSKSGSVVCTS